MEESMNPVKQALQHLVVSFGSLFLLTSLFAQELPSSQTQSLTPERIVSRPSLNGELLLQLHWSHDGRRLAFLQVSTSPSPSPSRTSRPPSTEIWSIDPATGHRSLLVSSSQLETALKAAKSVQQSGDDGDRPSEP